jgi:transcription elongation factor Elf1
MAIYTDSRYVRLISSRLRNFKQKSTNLWNFSCPFCGDSQTNKLKARGYVYAKGNDLFYRCHNCGVGTNVANLLKQVDPSIHDEYLLERYKEGTAANTTNTYHTKSSSTPGVYIKPPKFGRVQKRSVFEHATWASDLPSGHFCLNYIENRLIPKEHYNKLLFTSNYKAFCDALIPEHGKELVEDARLVIPFYNEYDELVAVSGRALETSDYKLRYVTLRTNDSEDKLIYGMERVNLNKKVYLVEGPIDSLFLDNCLASGDANLGLTMKNIHAKDITLVFDNEPRNKEVCKLIEKAIKSDHNVVIWPDTVEGKDINEMILNGHTASEIQEIIDSNTFYGLKAVAQFTFWKRV